MHVIRARNVHQALPEACHQIGIHGTPAESRNGPVVQFDEPLTVMLRYPWERVLFWPERDANPFFHLAESLWMLNGRNDVEFVSRYNSRMREFSDDGLTFNAAYGHRWRAHFGRDQVAEVSRALRENPSCRRQVIAMWDARRDLGLASKDLPCNLLMIFQRDQSGRLDMVVSNRSNDLVWGMLGANAVHLTVLQEYVAALVGCGVGRSWQVSSNAHYYVERHGELVSELAMHAPMPPTRAVCPYSCGRVRSFEMIGRGELVEFERDLGCYLRGEDDFKSPFFRVVVAPMERAWEFHKAGRTAMAAAALSPLCDGAATIDWHLAGYEWLQRRLERKAA